MILKEIRFNQDDMDKYSNPDFVHESQRVINCCRDQLIFDSYYLPSELREHYRNLVRELDDFLLSCSNVILKFSTNENNC